MRTTYVGDNGTARELSVDIELSGADTTVAWWLLEGSWHPIWNQFVISVVHLRDIPGVPPAHKQFEGATHELLVLALNPDTKHTVESMEKSGIGGKILTPVDVVHQFTATDEEMAELVNLCAKACVDGVLTPSTDDSRELLREMWLTACVKTLGHMRGEEHAS